MSPRGSYKDISIVDLIAEMRIEGVWGFQLGALAVEGNDWR